MNKILATVVIMSVIGLTATPAVAQTTTETGGFTAGDKQDPGEIWDNFLLFVAFIVGVFAGIAGLGSRSMAVGVLAAYSVFAHITVETGSALLTNILYITLVVVVVGMAMKLWRMEFGGEI